MLYRFDNFIVNDQQRTLSVGKTNIPLSGKMYQLLLLFILNAGNVIRKKQIYADVWEGKIVSDSTLYKLIELLRSKLNDNKDQPKYIHTIHGEGYLFSDIVTKVKAPDKHKSRLSFSNKYTYLLLILILTISTSIMLFSQTDDNRFNSIKVEVEFDTTNGLHESIGEGLNIFIKDLLGHGLQNMKFSKEITAKESKDNLLLEINLNSHEQDQWSATLQYINSTSDETINYELIAENLDSLLKKVISQVKATPLTKSIVDHSSVEFSNSIDANLLHIHALAANQLGNFHEGKNKLLKALAIDERYPMAKFDLAISERNLSHLDKSLAIINSLFILNNNLYFQMKISKLKGNILLNQNRFKETREQYFLALELANNLNLTQQQISLSINLSILYKKLCQYPDSIQLITNTIQTMKETKQLSYLGYAYGVLAETHTTINNINQSISETNKAIEVFKEQKNNAELARNHLRLAWLYLLNLNDDKYQENIQKAEKIYKSSDNRIGQENTFFIKFMFALHHGQLDSSLQLLNQQQNLSESLENASSLLRFYEAKALYAQFTNDHDTAFTYYKKYEELALDEKLNYEQLISLLYLVEIELIRKRYESAKNLLERASSKDIAEIQEELQYRQGLYAFKAEKDQDQARKLFQQSFKTSKDKGNFFLAKTIQNQITILNNN